MAWLFFIDESGHDHKNTPYEVRGGFAIHVSKLWSFVQDMQRLEAESFGCQLHEYKKELKGSTLIDRKRFKDETEKREDQKFVARIERYFTKTTVGQSRTEWIVPTPLFVSSDMTAAVQAADVCIYCVNWGFRLPRRGMNAEHREEIKVMFEGNLKRLQFRNRRYEGGREYITYGIVYVPDPYKSRTIP